MQDVHIYGFDKSYLGRFSTYVFLRCSAMRETIFSQWLRPCETSLGNQPLKKNINKNFWAKDPYVVVYNWWLQILEMSMCWMLIFFFTSEHQPFHIIFFSPRIYGCIYLTQRLYVSVILCNCGMSYIKRFPYIKPWIPMSLQWDNFLALSGTTWPCGASWTRSSGDK